MLTSILGIHCGVIGCSHSEEGGCIGVGLDSRIALLRGLVAPEKTSIRDPELKRRTHSIASEVVTTA